jgi:hypothetical protein
MFVVSRSCVLVYWLNTERCVTLDSRGAPPACCVLADKHRLTVAVDDVSLAPVVEDASLVYLIDLVLIDQQSVGKRSLYLMNIVKKECPSSGVSIIFEIVPHSDPPCY